MTTLAGSGSSGVIDGVGTSASFTAIAGLAVSSLGTLFVSNGYLIRKCTSSGKISTERKQDKRTNKAA